MDASKKIFVVTGIIVFDFEVFIGGLWQKRKELATILSYQLFNNIERFVSFSGDLLWCGSDIFGAQRSLVDANVNGLRLERTKPGKP